MKVGLLGAGRIAHLHARTLADHPDVDRLLIGDIDTDRARALADQVGGKGSSVDELFESGPETLVIAAATTAHAQLIKRGLERDLPMYCEKPVALTLEETREVVDAVEAAGATLQVGFQRRFDPGYREAKRMVQSGEIGTLYQARMCTHDPEPPHEEYIPQSGRIFRDLFIHDFDALRWVTGREAEEVTFYGSVLKYEIFSKYDDVDTSAGVIRMEDGVLAVLTGGRQDPLGYDIRMELFGSDDSISVGLDDRTPLRSVEPGAEELFSGEAYSDFTVRFHDAYRDELDHFLQLARGRAENPCTARDAMKSMKLAVAAETSFDERRPVELSELPSS